MIGVIANEAESPLVREFFELFKTPWEFYRRERAYQVLLCASDPVPESAARLVMVYGAGENSFDQARGIQVHSRDTQPVLAGRKCRLPIYGKWAGLHGGGDRLLVDSASQEAVGVSFSSGGQTFVRLGFDLFQEVHHLLCYGQPVAHARIPTLELHIELIRDLILESSLPLVEIPPVPAGCNFIACLTHDVDHFGIRNHKCDHTLLGFLYRALVGSVVRWGRREISVRQLVANWGAVARLPLVHFGLAKDFWCQLDRYLEIEKGMRSTFFVIPYKNRPGRSCQGRSSARRAARYDLADLREEMRRLNSAGCEIGVHGIDAWCDAASGRAERARVAEASGASGEGVRMHWLYFDEQSPAILEASGFSYDSTVGYNDGVGYRAGTLQVFKPPGVTRLLELPLQIMDTALFYPVHLNLSPAAAEIVVAELMEEAGRFGGALTINWHDRSIAPERLWDGFYVKLLQRLERQKAWLPTASQAVAWFRKRRSAVIQDVAWREGSVRVRASLDSGAVALPALRIRVHHPASAHHPVGGHVDVPFNGDFEEGIPLYGETAVRQTN